MIPLPLVTGHILVTSTPLCSRFDLASRFDRIISLIIGIITKRSQILPSFPYCLHPTPLRLESNLSCFPCPNNCLFPSTRHLPTQESPSIAHILNLAYTFTGPGQRGCLVSLCVPIVNDYY